MATVYTTGDGLAYGAEDGTPLVLDHLSGLITDREVADVAAVRALENAIKAGTATEEQVQQYLNVNQKGAYTCEDLNRVELAVGYVAERLRKIGYPQTLFTTWNWTVGDKPNENDFIRYFSNVATLRKALTMWEGTPEPPSRVEGFDVNKANALEQILLDIDRTLNLIASAWFYSGDLYSGEL